MRTHLFRIFALFPKTDLELLIAASAASFQYENTEVITDVCFEC